jgi:hypothetical protein
MRAEEKNTSLAFERALRAGYGIETDIRDRIGELVISHDPPTTANTMTFADFARLYGEVGADVPLALNIKADGLQAPVLQCLTDHGISNYFVFDMAVPDAIGYWRQGAVTFTRQSVYEHVPSFYEQSAGVWVDCFDGKLISTDLIAAHLTAEKSVALVSPELHRQPHEAAWKQWKSLSHLSIMLCTDFPDRADEFFND